MDNCIYIDESGSINNSCKGGQWFVITLLYVIDNRKLKSSLKRFIKANIDSFKKLQKASMMFDNGKFVELKGAALTPQIKIDFIRSLSQDNSFKLIFIKVDNSKLKLKFCQNTARSFNYLIRKTLEVLLHNKVIQEGDYQLFVDERNVRTGSRNTLEDYLNTELSLCLGYEINFKIKYGDSRGNRFIQLADVFSNIFYSSIFNSRLELELKKIEKNDYIPLIFNFPLN